MENEFGELGTVDNLEFFSLNGLIVNCKVVDVYDGDTVTVVFRCDRCNDTYYKWRCRIMGIDTPEIRTKNSEEKRMGLYVRDRVRERILNNVFSMKCYKFDKYGRLLVDIYIDDNDKTLSDWLIENDYALPYDGKTTKSKNYKYSILDVHQT
ncbi:nuclease [Heterosigma akashiwo virus 01]|jgi:micrococcal nuclease|uniref:Nuclease n=1 Tax=Heterosigma akashiwo virus 01 TaxID=97195 RepID=A0A1C9C5C6_HAV01|nr:endonuclease [Heterosigma akashiwo virus 01]AOM63491.1 nuclease [Heterosigma akashiwo virus 01]